MIPFFESTLKIDLNQPDVSIISGHIKIGGTNPEGLEIAANSRYLTLGGQPWFPVVGEFHFARYPREEWEGELLKMKAGGITVAATYVFWIYHKEKEGEWNWTGNRDLRALVELCAKHGLYSYPRIGPWAHGEVRNGGFPDWLLARCGKELRTNAEPYLGSVKKFYGQIAEQLKGLLWKEGGPVIGTQIENELTNNPAHLLTLKNLAREVGIDVPLYTVTGWMGVQFPEDEVLPVFGGYPDAFWSPQIDGWARESRVNYFFNYERDDSTIGADLATAGGGSRAETMRRYPYATVELGGGMQVSYRRRPVIEAEDIAALCLVKIGSGSNMQGYYMYHGGANQIGELSTLNESRATGYPNDTPVIDYDFQAPLGKYGQRRDSYHELRMQNLFLQDFGQQLAALPATLPENQPSSIDDRCTLRWSVRSDGRRGFIFINNYQRIEGLPAHEDVRFELKLLAETLQVPSKPIRIPAQRYMVWPFNMDLGGVRLTYATAQPLCRVGETFVFFAQDGVPAEFLFAPETLADATLSRIYNLDAGSLFEVKAPNGAGAKVLLLSRKQARQAYKATVRGADYLFVSEAGLSFEGDTVRLQARDPSHLTLAVYPPPTPEKEGSVFNETSYGGDSFPREIAVEWKRIKRPEAAGPVRLDCDKIPVAPGDDDFEHAGVWHVSFRVPAGLPVGRIFLRVRYFGDVARAYVGDRLIDDDFYHGRVWEIAVSRFSPEAMEEGITLKILPLRKDAPIYIPKDRLPRFDDSGEAVGIDGMVVEFEYDVVVPLEL